MWEQIRANRVRSIVLVFVMLLLLAALGAAIGGAVLFPDGIFIGVIVAAAVWLILWLVARVQGDNILLTMSGATEIQKKDHPQLFNVVEEMTISSRLPKMPRVFIIPDQALNAFATGRTPENSAVAITSGLLSQLNRDQLQGVIAHEIGHVRNRDIQYMTLVGVMLGAIVMMSELFLRGMFRASVGSRYRGGGKRGSQGTAVLLIVAVLLAILAPILGQMVYFACSRRREYLADASAAVFTRYPEGLASALELLGRDTHKMERISKATAPMFIVNPLQKGRMAAFALFSTHPPLEQRVRILRGMGGGVSFAKYQQAWQSEAGVRKAIMPASALREGAEQAVREPAAAPAPESAEPRKQFREAGDIVRRINQFAFLSCVCGLKIKVPPGFTKTQVACPRCGERIAVPRAET